MFASLQPELTPKQYLPFVASLWLQFTLTLLILGIGGNHLGPISPSMRPHLSHPDVAPIYFQPVPSAPPVTAEAAPPDPEPAPAARPAPQPATKSDETETASNKVATSDDSSAADGTGQGLAPFPQWSMSSPTSRGMFHHQVKDALPVFTPDPPILHGPVPELARGKDILLEIVIDDQGSIIQATVIQGVNQSVESSIMETLRRWIFVPAKINGMAVACRRQVRFHFPG